DIANYPSYVAVTPSGNSSYTWASSTSDPRAPQKGSSTTDRISACWYSGSSFSLSMAFNDSNPHQLALYLLDWDAYGGGRTERVDVLDSNGNLLDTRSASGFGGGLYLVWSVRGSISIRITNTNPSSNALMTALFFGAGGAIPPQPSAGTASFVKTDTA